MSDASATTEAWTVDRLLKWTRGHFESKGLDDARLRAELLLAHALGCRKIDLYTRFDQVPQSEPLSRFREMVKAAARAEPIAYLIGRKEFYSLDFDVTPEVLIPRPETELVVEEALAWIKNRSAEVVNVLDIGTGSGCIAVTLAKRSPGAVVVAADVSPGALAVAQKNAEKHGVASRVRCVEADLLSLPADAIPPGGFDLVVSNPPYVARVNPDALADDVRRFEPALALFGGDDGLEFYRRIAAGIRPVLTPGGGLIVEIGRGQSAAVIETLTRDTGLTHRTTRRDSAGIERTLVFGPAS